MNSSYILRHATTGLFFDGTNFSSEAANKATRFSTAPAASAVRLIWACPVQVIEITGEQIAALEQSDELDARAEAHVAAGRAKGPRFAASSAGAASRLRKRAYALAGDVYSSFPRVGVSAVV